MKKSLMAILAAALVGAAWAEDTSADVLVWYLDTNEDMEHSGSEFDTIKFWAVDVNDSTHKIDLADRLRTAEKHHCRCVLETKTVQALETSVARLPEYL